MLEKNLTRLHAHSAPQFLALLLVVSLLYPLLILNFISNDDSPDPIERFGNAKYFVAVILAPLVETLLFQCISAKIIAGKRLAGAARLAVMVIPFALAHVQVHDLAASIVNGFAGSYVLGMCYLICSERSMWYAFATTASLHAAHNLFVMILFV